MQKQSFGQQRTPEGPEFDYYVTIIDKPEYRVFETQNGRFAIDWPSENVEDPVRTGDPSLSREAVIEALHEEALREERIRSSYANRPRNSVEESVGGSHELLSMEALSKAARAAATEDLRRADRAVLYPGDTTHQGSRRSNQERERYWSIEQSAEVVSGLIASDPKLAHAVNSLADGSIGVVRAIKERLADEVSYDPAEALTPERIRAIVGAPSDQALLDSWRESFYEPYRQKYRAEHHGDSE